MLTLMVRHKTIGFRWYQATNLDSLLQRIQWDIDRLVYMAPALAIVQEIVADRPQGYLPGHVYNIGRLVDVDFFDIYLDTGTGEFWENYKQTLQPEKS